MERREFIRKTLLGSAALGMATTVKMATAQGAAAAQGGERPNILFIIVHDLGTALHCYGEPAVRSPRLDALAAEGVRFVNYFCSSTPCSPSRGCIMTGRWAHCNGLIGLANRGWDLPASERAIVDYMNAAGYHTAGFGGQHERAGGLTAYAYKEAGTPGKPTADKVAGEVCDFLKRWDPKRGPFFINAYSQDVHAPWDRPEFQGKYDPEAITPPPFLPNIPYTRKNLSTFYGSIEFMDGQMGKIIDTLRETGLADNTILVFTTDHGVGFPRAKSTMYDPGLTTSLIVRWPGRIKGGRVSEHIIPNVDLLPTLLELAGQPVAPAIQGRSFAPYLLGGAYTPNAQVFSERNYHDDYDPIRAVRTTKHKLIRNYASRNRYKLLDEAKPEDDGLTLRNSGVVRPYEELYDLEKDPLEQKDVAGDPAYAGVLQDLRGRLDQWMRETVDYMRGAREPVMWPASDTHTGGPPIPNQTAVANARKKAQAAKKAGGKKKGKKM